MALLRPSLLFGRARRVVGRLVLVFLASAPLRAGYRIENVDYPPEIRGGISAIAFTPAGSLVIATRFGEVWMRRQDDGRWRCFARGLDEPLGLVAESERRIFVAHRPEFLRMTDQDGDGMAEIFDALGGDWGLTANYHQFTFGLRRDRAGNLYGAVSLDSTGGKPDLVGVPMPSTPTRGPRDSTSVIVAGYHRSEVPWRGWTFRIRPDGKFEPWAAGFRQPNGIGLSPDDELFVTDNQGDFKAHCGLHHVERGDFHGHPASLKWEPGFDVAGATVEQLWRRLKPLTVVFPHGPMGVSPGEPVWDLSGGRFGPFAGQVFVGEYSRLVIRTSLEKVAGAWQGGCYPFLGRNTSPEYVTGERLIAGATRVAFGPDGMLYLAATAGWGAGADGLQRVRWDGKVAPDVREVTLTDRGFRVAFTRPMERASLAQPENYSLKRFRSYYHWKYGSPWVDEADVRVETVRPAADALSAELVIGELKAGFVYEFSLPLLRTTAGEALANPLAYYTANRLHNGDAPLGGTTRLPAKDEVTAPRETISDSTPEAQLVAAGEKVYRLYCVACHQPDGRGVAGGAANFVDDRTRLAKPDSELLEIIARGNEAKGMPSFNAIIAAGQRRAVLAYIRATFGQTPKQN